MNASTNLVAAVVSSEPDTEVDSDNAASWSPVIQPSVRALSAATCFGSSRRVITSLRKEEVSSAVNRRSAARSSTSSPRARSRDSGSGGSALVLMAIVT